VKKTPSASKSDVSFYILSAGVLAAGC